jgi:tetratricopeptide (TPR) repeat protein
MSGVDPQTESAGTAPRAKLDTWLNAALIALLLLVVGGVGYFGYSVYAERQQQYGTSAAGRVAIALAEQVRKSPNDAVLRVRLGEALGASGKYSEAIEQLNAALKINPKHSGALFDLGTIATITKNYDQAKSYFTKVIDVTDSSQYSNMDPLREQAYYNLGVLALNDRNYAKAAGYLKASIAIRKDASDSYYQLAQALRGLGDNEGAIQNLEIAVQFDPSYADAHYFLGQLYKSQHDDVKASGELKKAATLAPNANEPRQALAAYGTAASWVSKAQGAQTSGDLGSALNAVQVARNLDASSTVAAVLQGDILVQQGNLKDALSAYNDALALSPKNVEVQAKIAKTAPLVKAATAKPSKTRKKK